MYSGFSEWLHGVAWILQIDSNKRSEKAQLDCTLHSVEKTHTRVHTHPPKKKEKKPQQSKTGENRKRIKYIIFQFL